MQNHGLILTGDDVDAIIKRSEEIEMFSHNFLNSLKTKFKIFELPELLGSDENCLNAIITKLIILNIVPNIFKNLQTQIQLYSAAQKF